MGFRLNLKGICRIELPLSKHGVLGAFHRFMIYDDFCQISIFLFNGRNCSNIAFRTQGFLYVSIRSCAIQIIYRNILRMFLEIIRIKAVLSSTGLGLELELSLAKKYKKAFNNQTINIVTELSSASS